LQEQLTFVGHVCGSDPYATPWDIVTHDYQSAHSTDGHTTVLRDSDNSTFPGRWSVLQSGVSNDVQRSWLNSGSGLGSALDQLQAGFSTSPFPQVKVHFHIQTPPNWTVQWTPESGDVSAKVTEDMSCPDNSKEP